MNESSGLKNFERPLGHFHRPKRRPVQLEDYSHRDMGEAWRYMMDRVAPDHAGELEMCGDRFRGSQCDDCGKVVYSVWMCKARQLCPRCAFAYKQEKGEWAYELFERILVEEGMYHFVYCEVTLPDNLKAGFWDED